MDMPEDEVFVADLPLFTIGLADRPGALDVAVLPGPGIDRVFPLFTEELFAERAAEGLRLDGAFVVILGKPHTLTRMLGSVARDAVTHVGIDIAFRRGAAVRGRYLPIRAFLAGWPADAASPRRSNTP
jgi:hypothetical protein